MAMNYFEKVSAKGSEMIECGDLIRYSGEVYRFIEAEHAYFSKRWILTCERIDHFLHNGEAWVVYLPAEFVETVPNQRKKAVC